MNLFSARHLMHEWVNSQSLRTHMECVSACMNDSALDRGLDSLDAERWAIAGLLHDFDYERHPVVEEHPFVGVKLLRELGVDEEICNAILGHATYSGCPRETPMAKHLFACDELSGLIVACARVRPNGATDLEPASVLKKLRTKDFAAGVNRDDVQAGWMELGVNPEEHISKCIAAIRRVLTPSIT